jgi:uncharacterized protein (DUF885 family)
VTRSAISPLLDAMLRERLDAFPLQATQLGLDTGEQSGLRQRLDATSAEAWANHLQHLRAAVNELEAVDVQALPAMARIDRDAVLFHTRAVVDAAAVMPHGVAEEAQPYAVTQLSGTYYALPDFLCTKHPVASASDAQAFIARLAAFAEALDGETARIDAAAAAGVVPPTFVLETTLRNMRALLATPLLETGVVSSLVQRARDHGIAGDWEDRARRILDDSVKPALARQVDSLAQAQQRSTNEAGVWKLPDGEASYEKAIVLHTTTRWDASAIHETGLAQVAELTGRLDAVLQGQGFSAGTVAERLAALAVDERFVYPNDEQGKAQLLGEMRAIVADVQQRLPALFDPLPKAALEVRAVPAAIEAGAPRGYYSSGSADGRNPAAFYVNLRDTRDWKRWYAPSFAYHEGVPGHHLQISTALESDGISMMRRALWFAAYGEGWALYAEQLADEIGLYERNPVGRIGYLQSMLFRAARLVVDTGLHARRWTREQAIGYLVHTVGETPNRARAEVDRYCVMPAQALSYKVGHLRWNQLREACRARQGSAFDLKRFHGQALQWGAMPLDMLDRLPDSMGAWDASQVVGRSPASCGAGPGKARS